MRSEIISLTRFIREVFEEPTNFIPLHEPNFCGNEIVYSEDCIRSTFVSSVGKYVDKFETRIAEYTGAVNAVACVNGTSALHLAMVVAGVESGSEVLTQSLSFIATCNAISYTGAKPLFIDVDLDTMGLSPVILRNFLNECCITTKKGCINKNSGKRISACVPMHTFGHPCRIDQIVEICDEFGIPVIEDAAESLGSTFKGKHTGTFGKIGVLSFNGNKIITTGGGGILLFNNLELAKKAKHLSTQAKKSHAWEFDHDYIGYNYRMPNINAALGLAQLENLDRFLEAKRVLAYNYAQFFLNKKLNFVSEPSECKSNYWLNAFITSDNNERDQVLEYLNSSNIMARPAWRLMNELPMFEKCMVYQNDNAKWLSERLINLPSSAKL